MANDNGGAGERFGEETVIETNVEKCPSCGANMTYSPARGALECPYCGTTRDVAAKTAKELEFERLLDEDDSWSSETRTFRCENCGAVTVIDEDEISVRCPFCGAGHVVEAKEISGLRPNAVVPFAITVQEASKNFSAWVKKRFFVPRRFKREAKTEEISGVYSPAFSFDTQTFSSYVGRLGKRHTKTRRVNGKTVTETEIRYFFVSGNYDCFFDDVLVQASSEISQKTVDELQPFDTNDSREYDKRYLSGFAATKNAESGAACWERAKKVIKTRIRAAVLSRYDYDVIDYLNVDTSCEEITYKYLLLPVYVGATRWKKKVYNFFVNGRSGKVTGKMPLSPLKILGVTLIGIAIAAAIIGLIITNGG